MATNTMDAIKKKMQAMKGEKDNALEKADQLEQRVAEQKAINEKVNFLPFHQLTKVPLGLCPSVRPFVSQTLSVRLSVCWLGPYTSESPSFDYFISPFQ